MTATGEDAAAEGCVCGHGAYNHGPGTSLIGRLLGQDSRCIRCSCMEFLRRGHSGSSARAADLGGQ